MVGRNCTQVVMISPSNHSRALWWYIATWFGCGLSPIVSGTVGSLGALPFAYIIQVYFGNKALFAAAFVIFFIGWWASNRYLKHAGRDDDPKEIVVDEVAGQWLLLSAMPLAWQSYLIGFVLFRAFDIVKPWPVSWADRNIKGGLGVMLDDMLSSYLPCIGCISLSWSILSFSVRKNWFRAR